MTENISTFTFFHNIICFIYFVFHRLYRKQNTSNKILNTNNTGAIFIQKGKGKKFKQDRNNRKTKQKKLH